MVTRNQTTHLMGTKETKANCQKKELEREGQAVRMGEGEGSKESENT